MKKLFYLLLAMPLLAFAACSDDDSGPADTRPSVSFDRPVTPLSQGKATLTLVVDGFDMNTMAEDEEIEIALTFGGDAVKGTDYKVSKESFLMKVKSPRTTITLTSNNFTTDTKNVEVRLNAPEGFKTGKNATTKVALNPRQIFYSFITHAADMHDSMVIEVEMTDDAGSGKSADTEITIPLKVDASSTAVQGDNFEFAGGKAQIVIPEGKRSGTVDINLKNYDASKSKIVLDLGEVDGLNVGDPGRMTITMLPSYWDGISGTYTVEQQMLTREWLETNFYGMVTSYTGFPTLNTADKFTFDTANKKLKVELQSELRNFFLGDSNMTKDKEYVIYDMETMMQEIRVLMIDLDNCNRNFAPDSQSADTHSYIGVRKIKNDANEDRLELYIMDYIPTTFMLEILEFGFEESRPSAWGSGAYHLFILKPAA